MVVRHDGDDSDSGRSGGKASGSEEKVVEWVGRWWEMMIWVAARLLEDRDAAEDIGQRVFMKALSIARSDPDEVDGIRKPSAWLVEITRKQASGVLRTEKRRRRLRRENGDEIRDNLFPERDKGSEGDPRAERVLEAAPLVLTERQLGVVRLVWEGMEDDEIARELGLKRGTVRRHRTDAIRKLREHMSQEGGGIRHEFVRLWRGGMGAASGRWD